ncbi:MAG: hypothetical protein JWR89_5124 [Tardiphaga sp.]|nr:hypothetical protein [Tardiphaga sp.]
MTLFDLANADLAVTRDSASNAPSMPSIFSDYPVLIERNAHGAGELPIARWRMPLSSKALFNLSTSQARGRGGGQDGALPELLYHAHAIPELLKNPSPTGCQSACRPCGLTVD